MKGAKKNEYTTLVRTEGYLLFTVCVGSSLSQGSKLNLILFEVSYLIGFANPTYRKGSAPAEVTNPVV